jgi:hypothetical protein
MKKNKAIFLFIIFIASASVTYLLVAPLVAPLVSIPFLTFFAIMSLLLSVLSIFIVTGKISVVMDKKNRIYIIKKNKSNEK